MNKSNHKSSNPALYIHPDVEKVRSLHGKILEDFSFEHTIYDLLYDLAGNLHESNQSGDERALVEIKSYIRVEEFTQPEDQLKVDESLAREIMARQHGFRDWQEVKGGGDTLLTADFERAVDAVITGNLDELNHLLHVKPHLAIQRSAYFHKATLLHYASANGVEIRRQIIPENLPEMVRLLLAKGADPNARGYFYGKMIDIKTLLVSGSYSKEAGVYKEVLKLI